MNPQSEYQNEIIKKCINSKLEQEIWVILFNERKRERERERTKRRSKSKTIVNLEKEKKKK